MGKSRPGAQGLGIKGRVHAGSAHRVRQVRAVLQAAQVSLVTLGHGANLVIPEFLGLKGCRAHKESPVLRACRVIKAYLGVMGVMAYLDVMACLDVTAYRGSQEGTGWQGRRVIVDRQERKVREAMWDGPVKMACLESRVGRVTKVRRAIEVSPACEAAEDHKVRQVAEDRLVREVVSAKEDARAREENRVSRSCKVYDAYTVSRDDLVASA